ncbi:1-deoxy-D-xylulose-5-phosphate synthase [Sunxiuqinia sp. sy24]|uniref:1-deoxy-D-xylulose-5-phosphate synthase n=1 Tax=Sunxiuqinia sp. sy24 TaxID=3461495 RepID=UPI004045972F
MEEPVGSILEKINTPADLRQLNPEDLILLCDELRQFIIDEVSHNPGHLGASLGVVELTVALHYAYHTPYDQLIWDVGHQAYGHKILTGRRAQFHTNRKYKGISGFPKPAESEYDAFGVGHASTSISAALGMAQAASVKNEKDRKVVAVIGDGSMTGGMAFEGLNNAGFNNSDVLIVLNDNQMAIDPNVGGVSNYLLNISKSKSYNKLKNEIWEGLGKLNGFGPKARRLVQKTEGALKSYLLKESNLFESLGIRYFGPVDGHDVEYLSNVLRDLREIQGPKLLHVITKKGKGFKLAEMNQTVYHAPGKFDKDTGKIIGCECELNKPPKFQNVFGNTLVELAEKNPKIVGVTPAMPTGCSLNIMMDKMPDRAFDVGIAEPHAVTFSAGMAIQGLVPFCNIYSSFMQRAYDQIIHDVAIQNLNVVLCLDRGGLVGADGATHHGVFDLAYMRSVPNMVVSAPMDEIELRNLMFTAQQDNMGPFSIRYPRGCGCKVDWRQPFELIEVGKGRIVTEGDDLAVLTIGTAGIAASRAVKSLHKKEFSVAHYDMRFVKPLDEELLHQIFQKYKKVITVEDGVILGGFGSAVLEFMVAHAYQAQVVRLGVPDHFIEHGTPEELQRDCGYDQKGIYQSCIDLLQR